METIKIATWNIHKGVNGLQPRQRLEIHNIGLAIDQFDADIVCLQEVHKMHRRHSNAFKHWPSQEQADFLAPIGYTPVYQTNAITKHGEHGNALLTRWPVMTHQHEDMSDHRFEQRGLLHVETVLHGIFVHVIVIHLGLIKASRQRQLNQLCAFIKREIPASAPLIVAGDFNDWGNASVESFKPLNLVAAKINASTPKKLLTFPSRLPLVQLDYVFSRYLTPLTAHVPTGKNWARMSDHLPLLTEFVLDKSRFTSLM